MLSLEPLLFHGNQKNRTPFPNPPTESEYKAMVAAICELTWIRYFLSDLRLNISTPSTLYYDNQAALHIAVNPVFHERMKHIKLDCHLVRDKIFEGQITTTHVFSSF